MKQLMESIKKEKDPTKLYILLKELEINITKNYKRDFFILVLHQILFNFLYIIGFVNIYVFTCSEHSSEIISENIPIIKSILEFSPTFQAPFWMWSAIVFLVPPIITGIIKAITKVFVKKATVDEADTGTKTAADVLLKLKNVRSLCLVDDRITTTVLWGSLAIHFALAVLFWIYKSELYITSVFLFLLAMVILLVVMMFINVINVYFAGAVPCFDQPLDKRIKEFETYAKEEEQIRIAEEQAHIAEEQARIAEEQARIAEEQAREEAKKAAELFAQATRSETTNMAFLIQAADLGNPDACKEYGKMLYLETSSNPYTRSEKEDKCRIAARYLEKAKDQDMEAEFLWLACRITYESNDADGWKDILSRVRRIKNAGKISENYTDSIDTMIQLLVQTIDSMEAKQYTAHSKSTGFYCRFYNAGICNHQSTEYYIHKCTDPTNQSCTHALLNNGIASK